MHYSDETAKPISINMQIVIQIERIEDDVLITTRSEGQTVYNGMHITLTRKLYEKYNMTKEQMEDVHFEERNIVNNEEINEVWEFFKP